MAVLDLTDPVDIVRLNIGDTSDINWLSDVEIQYALDSNSGNINAATKQSATYILARLAFSGRERLDKLEFYGSEVYNNYLKFLKEIINSAVYSGTAGIYVAGLDLADVQNNINDKTIVQHKMPIYPEDSYDDSNSNVYGTPSTLF